MKIVGLDVIYNFLGWLIYVSANSTKWNVAVSQTEVIIYKEFTTFSQYILGYPRKVITTMITIGDNIKCHFDRNIFHLNDEICCREILDNCFVRFFGVTVFLCQNDKKIID